MENRQKVHFSERKYRFISNFKKFRVITIICCRNICAQLRSRLEHETVMLKSVSKSVTLLLQQQPSATIENVDGSSEQRVDIKSPVAISPLLVTRF